MRRYLRLGTSRRGRSGRGVTWAAGDGELQRRANDQARFLGGPHEAFEAQGRLMFIALLRRGLTPDATVLDVGCGALRAGYWLIHFLDADRYLGTEPGKQMLDQARGRLLEPGLEEAKRPRFSADSSFDFATFGAIPRFVLMRSIWSHAGKPQIETMLDSFARIAAPDSLLLASYLPARRRSRAQNVVKHLRRLVPQLPGNSTSYQRRIRRDYRRDTWSRTLIAHDLRWVEAACARRRLTVTESPTDSFGLQVWLEIRPAARP